MIWDSQSQAFKESETPKTYNPQLDAWQESTGYEYNHGLGAWEKVWPEISVYVYGAASETITIARNGIAVATVNTNANGRTDEQVHLSKGTYTLTGSVSGWTETQEVDSDTDRLRVMPDKALYWYGIECIPFSDGTFYKPSEGTANPYITRNLNSIYMYSNAVGSGYGNTRIYSTNKIHLENVADVVAVTDNQYAVKEVMTYIDSNIYTQRYVDIANTGDAYIGFRLSGSPGTLYALYLI